MAEQIYFEDIAEGDEIPVLEKSPTTQQLVHWAAGSGDFYQIHYDTAFAHNTGLDGIIVHGALKHAWLGELLHRFASPGGRVRRVACSYRGMDVPGQTYRLRGTVTKNHEEVGRGPHGRAVDLGRERVGPEDDAGHGRRGAAVAVGGRDRAGREQPQNFLITCSMNRLPIVSILPTRVVVDA